MNLKNIHNQYAAELGDLFDRTPKTVIAAIAVSMLTEGGSYLEETRNRFLNEWRVLYENKIVPQKPPRKETAKAQMWDKERQSRSCGNEAGV